MNTEELIGAVAEASETHPDGPLGPSTGSPGVTSPPQQGPPGPSQPRGD